MNLKENAGKYSVGAMALTIIIVLIQLNIFMTKAEAYRDFVTQEDFNKAQDKLDTKLDYIIDRLDLISGGHPK